MEMTSTEERLMPQASTLEKEKNEISIIVLPDKLTYLARWGIAATLFFLSASVLSSY